MDVSKALTELEQLAEKLAIEVVYDTFTGDGMSSGGLCKVKGSWRVIIERRSPTSEKISVLARALSRFDLEELYVSPAVRELIERYQSQA
jgi:ribosomal protein L20A (L18A)